LVTCNNGIELNFAYNQTEADKNILFQKESSANSVDTIQNGHLTLNDTIKTGSIAPKDTATISSDTTLKSTDFSDKVFKKIIMSTDTSLSGIGSIFYFKNMTGKIAIAISLLISLILFATFKFLKSYKKKIYLLSVAALSLAIFIVDSFISNVTLLWGIWTLLGLILLQVILEFKTRGKLTPPKY
jgi:hypothetical protein